MSRRVPKMLPIGRMLAVGLLAVAGAGGCGSPIPTGPAPASVSADRSVLAASAVPPPSAGTSLDRVAGWQADIDALLDARDHLHPDGWHGMKRDDWIAAADAAKDRIAGETDDQALVELVRLAAMSSWAGRDGHSGIFPFIPGSGTHVYPLRWWRFSDGLVITAARAPYERLVGARVEAVGGRPIADVLALVEPLAPRDNPSNLLAYGPLYLRSSELLTGLGIIPAVGPATFSVVARDGTRSDVAVEPISPEDDVAWTGGDPTILPARDGLWLHDQAKPMWWTDLPDRRTLYVQQNAVEAGITALSAEIVARSKQPGIDRVVLDLRHNGGGDNTTLGPIDEALREPTIDRPGRFFVLISRSTFSAAANFATDLEGETGAIFAGEAMGGSPNLYGDARPIDLPYGTEDLYMATRYWERSTPDDPRLTIEPSIRVGLSSADYFAGRDPVLDAVLAAPLPAG